MNTRSMTPFFKDVPTFVPQISEYGNFSVRQSYTQFVAQETSIIRNLFIFSKFDFCIVDFDQIFGTKVGTS